jgi:hypothetical protein
MSTLVKNKQTKKKTMGRITGNEDLALNMAPPCLFITERSEVGP